MKREDIDLSGAFNDGFELSPFWQIMWDWLSERIKNCIRLPADHSKYHCRQNREDWTR